MTAPCITCPDRFPACHDTCAKYISWKSWQKLRTTRPDNGGAAYFIAGNAAKQLKKNRSRNGGKAR